MELGLVDVFTILLVTIGPLKAMVIFTAITGSADDAFRRTVAIKGVMVAAIVLLLFVVAGEFLLQIFHVSLPALKIAGGLILVLFALGMVMGSGNHGEETGGNPSPDIAIYPLAMPAIATPQGIVAVVTLAAAADLQRLIIIAVMVLAIMAINLGTLLAAGRIVAWIGPAGLQIMAKVAGILLAALAVQLMISALRDLGALPAVTH